MTESFGPLVSSTGTAMVLLPALAKVNVTRMLVPG